MSKNKLLVLTFALTKNLYSLPKERKQLVRQLALVGVLALSLGPMVFNIIHFMASLYDGLAAVGEQGAMLSLGIAVSALVIFIFGLLYTMNTFYFSEDIETLLPLPVKPAHILGAKFIIVTAFEYLTASLILLPILVVYGLKAGEGFVYYFYALLIFLTVPVLPIALDSAIVMGIMRVTNLAKNKDAFRVISAVIAILFGLSVNIFAQRMTFSQGIEQISLGNNSLISVTAGIFPLSKLGTLGLINSGKLSGLLYTGLFLGSSLLGFLIFLYLGNLLYYRGVTGVTVSTSKQKHISRAELSRQTVKSSAIKAYVLKELRILFRTPSYFINCVLMNFLWPVLVSIPILTKPKSAGGLGRLLATLQDRGMWGSFVAGAFAVILFVTASNGIASTAISREGDNILFSKYIPLHFKTQILAKVVSGVLMGIVALATLSIAAVVLLKLSLFLLALIWLTGLLGILFSSLIGILLDLFNPKLHWDNEQQAVKRNMNLLISMALCTVVGGFTAFAVVKLNLSVGLAAGSLFAVFGILDIVLYRYLMKKGVALFSQIEY